MELDRSYNVRLVTLDSCRYDSAQKAHTPTLNSVSKLMRAEVDGTYTYPSHHSMFIGILPRKLDENPQYLSGYDQIWRSGGARASDKSVFQPFTEATIIKHYEDKGYVVAGFGGVQFFNPNLGCNTLPKSFKNFTHFGPPTYTPEYKTLPRDPKTFPLENIDQIVNSIKRKAPYFLFINCPETHNPYDTPATSVNGNYVELIKRLNHEHATKEIHPQGNLPLSSDEISLLKAEQIRALEFIDTKLGLLFEELDNNFPTLTIVVGDHGDEFGEEGRFGHAHNAETVRTVPLWVNYDEK